MMDSALDALLKFLQESPIIQSSDKLILSDLAFLIAFLLDPPQKFAEDGTLQLLQSIASDTESIISMFDLNKMNEALTLTLESKLLETLMRVRCSKDEAKLIFEQRPKPSRFYYPRTSQMVYIDHLLENLEELMKETASSTLPLNHLISRVLQELTFWNSHLKEISEQPNKKLYLRVTNLANEVEYAIDSFLFGDFSIWHCMFWLLNVLKTFEQVEALTSDEQIVVGFKPQMNRMHKLLTDWNVRRLITVVGAAGQGKTTFTKKLYDDPSVIEHFHIRSWCCISQQYNRRETLLQILGQPECDQGTDEDLRIKLSDHLWNKRFLIVVDDIWSTEDWNDLKTCIPKGSDGSRIVMTTRMRHLAYQDGSERVMLPLFPLSNDESWDLLCEELFQDDGCPVELSKAGKEIANKCKGLPLSIVSTASLLLKMEKTKKWWEQMPETLTTHILKDAKAETTVTLESSYTNLPDYLKLCFLYFGVFLDDREILISKLIRLWVAEGLIDNTPLKCLEDVAEEYLMDLISRSLVMGIQMKSTGGVKSCRVEDLLGQFCLTKAKAENSLQLIKGYDKFFSSSSSSSSSSKPIIYHQRYLSIHSKREHFLTLKPSGPFAKSLLFFANNDMCLNYSYNIPFNFNNFKILRILDFEDINIGDSFKEIGVLVLLRYLAVQSSMDSIPLSISNLWNLETLLFRGLNSQVVKVPDSIWDMTKLRHIHINEGASFDIEPHRLENSLSILDNLQTIYTPSFSYGDDTEKIIRRLVGIRKLKCIFLDSWDDVKKCNRFPVLEFLSQLVSLKVFYNGICEYPCNYSFPSNLKKLTLSNFRMSCNEIAKLVKLENLEALKLKGDAFEGKTWEMKEDVVFPKLKFLKLDNVNIVRWSGIEDHFPLIERLHLHKCKELEEIPQCFLYGYALYIEVMWCNPLVANDARRIKQEFMDIMGIMYQLSSEMKIHVYPTEFDPESSS